MTKAEMLQVDQVDIRAHSDNQLHLGVGEERRSSRPSSKPRSGYNVHHPHHHHHRRLHTQEPPPEKLAIKPPVLAPPIPPTPADPVDLNDPFEKHFLLASNLQTSAQPVRSSSFREEKAKPVVQKRRDSDGNYSSSPNLLFPKDDLQVDAARSGETPFRRVRSFKTTSKGGVLNRGDSFRKKSSNRNLASGSTVDSVHDSPRADKSSAKMSDVRVHPPARDALPSYFKVQILGAIGCGKTSITNQFMSSDFANAFESMNGKQSMLLHAWRSQNGIIFTHIQKTPRESPWYRFKMEAVLKGKNLLPVGANSFL